ncbi:hypothetical protein EMIT0158MI4_30379 [Burkholderia ambifaria]
MPASVRTRWPGYPACTPSSGCARAHGPTRTAAASPKRAPRTMREPEYRASRFRYGTPRRGRQAPESQAAGRFRRAVDSGSCAAHYLRYRARICAGNLFTMPARRSLHSRRRVCSHVTWSLDPPHSQWIESPPNLAFTQGHNEWESSLPTYSIRRTVVPVLPSRWTSTRSTANRAARSRPC